MSSGKRYKHNSEKDCVFINSETIKQIKLDGSVKRLKVWLVDKGYTDILCLLS